jgi:S-methylmethionine-dependent homocysteine/selenocysteine methylase
MGVAATRLKALNTQAAQRVGLPVAISFTVETDGRMPSGETLGDAIKRADACAAPANFAINCAEPRSTCKRLDEEPR